MEELLMQTETQNEAQTEQAGKQLAKRLLRGDFVAMYGDLGAGKTAFVRGIASLLAPEAPVHSPTYTIVNEYTCKDGQQLRHLDLYRIRDEEDLYSIGFYDFPQDGYTVAEWCERIPYALPPRYLRVTIEKTGEATRLITVYKITA